MSNFHYSQSISKGSPRKPNVGTGDDLTQEVIKWSLQYVATPPAKGSLIPLRERNGTNISHLGSFLELIKEDARAVVAQGLEDLARKRCKVTLLSMKEPRNKGNPWVLTFEGEIDTGEEDNNLSFAVVEFMRTTEDKRVIEFLGVANSDRDADNIIKVRALIRSDIRGDKGFQPGQAWVCSFLGSVLTHDRMFSACMKLGETPFPILDQLVRGTFPQYPRVQHRETQVSGLNPSQCIAVQTFLSHEAKLVLLQGPPGTGKTSTIAALLKQLYAGSVRTLVFAPSNKAVEVLASRFYDDNSQSAMLLVGTETKINKKLFPVLLSAITKKLTAVRSIAFQILGPIIKECVQLSPKLPNAKASKAIHAKLAHILPLLAEAHAVLEKYGVQIGRNQISALYYKIKELPSPPTVPDLECVRNLVAQYVVPDESEFLNNAKVLFCTLSVSGRFQMLAMNRPVALIVDEAGQSVEAETLIALQHLPDKVLLVGDTKQLPATVISTHAKEHNYDWSLMHRLADRCRAPMLMLEEQYRMHPSISKWPSERYYDNKLTDGASIATRARPASCPQWLLPIAFYDMSAKQNKETKVGKSTANAKEAKYIARVLCKLRLHDPDGSVGIIVPYKAQIDCVKEELKACKVDIANTRISSVDAFQGDECDYIFLSFVRFGGTVGFTGDFQRLNVAVTRAKHALFMVGSVATLKKADEFASLFVHLRKKQTLFTEEALVVLLDTPSPDRSEVQVPSTGGDSKKKKKKGKNKGQQSAESSSSDPPPPARAPPPPPPPRVATVSTAIPAISKTEPVSARFAEQPRKVVAVPAVAVRAAYPVVTAQPVDVRPPQDKRPVSQYRDVPRRAEKEIDSGSCFQSLCVIS